MVKRKKRKTKKRIKKVVKESLTSGDVIAHIVWWNPWVLYIIIVCLIVTFLS
jgi:hypothetical protein